MEVEISRLNEFVPSVYIKKLFDTDDAGLIAKLAMKPGFFGRMFMCCLEPHCGAKSVFMCHRRRSAESGQMRLRSLTCCSRGETMQCV